MSFPVPPFNWPNFCLFGLNQRHYTHCQLSVCAINGIYEHNTTPYCRLSSAAINVNTNAAIETPSALLPLQLLFEQGMHLLSSVPLFSAFS